MYPALSLILFTTLSGAGFGLLGLLGLLAMGGLMPAAAGFGPVAALAALALIVAGLGASTRHLGRPGRLLLALTQWRTLWLSREALAASVSLPVALAFALSLGERAGTVLPIVIGGLAAALATASVVCTAMIYATLRPIPQWSNRLVLPCFLLLAAMTGGVLLVLLAVCFGAVPPCVVALTIVAILAAWTAKVAYWRQVDGLPARSDLAGPEGLGRLGPLRLLDPALSFGGFTVAEMGRALCPPLVRRLRRVAVVLLFAVPLPLTALQPVLAGTPGVLAAGCAVLAAAVGVGVERWLFFAEARHACRAWYAA